MPDFDLQRLKFVRGPPSDPSAVEDALWEIDRLRAELRRQVPEAEMRGIRRARTRIADAIKVRMNMWAVRADRAADELTRDYRNARREEASECLMISRCEEIAEAEQV